MELLNKILILDGAMGTVLQQRGLAPGGVPELLNLTEPELLASIYREYVEAGSQVVYANTFGANGRKLAGTGHTVEKIVSAAIRLAKDAVAGTGALVALDVGPLGELLEPMGSLPFERAAYQWCASASIYLCPEAKGKGIGKKLYTKLWQLLQLQGYRKVYAVITTANEDSIAFHRALGYRRVATMPDCGYKLGKRYGNVWMEKELNSWDTPPGEPVPICRLLEH